MNKIQKSILPLVLVLFISLHQIYPQLKSIKFEKIGTEKKLSQNQVFCIYQDSKGFLWFGTQDGLNLYDGYTFRVFRHQPGNENSLLDYAVNAICESDEGIFWIGTREGLSKFNLRTGNFTHYTHNPDSSNSLVDNNVWGITKDSENNLWIGTRNGLSHFNPTKNKFTNYVTSTGENTISHNFVLSIIEDANKNIWIGTELGNIFKLDNPFKNNSTIQQFGTEKYLKTFFRSVEIRSFMEDKTGQIWAASFGNGIYIIDPLSNNVKRINQNDSQTSISNDFVHCIYQSSDGNIWIGTGAGGLNKYNPLTKEFIFYQNDPQNEKSISTNEVTAIVEDNLNQIWAGTSVGGLNLLIGETGEFEHFIHDVKNINSLSSNRIICLYNDQKGNLWIGTFGGGLNKRQAQSKTFKHFTTEDGLPSNIVNSIVEDFTRKIKTCF